MPFCQRILGVKLAKMRAPCTLHDDNDEGMLVVTGDLNVERKSSLPVEVKSQSQIDVACITFTDASVTTTKKKKCMSLPLSYVSINKLNSIIHFNQEGCEHGIGLTYQ